MIRALKFVKGAVAKKDFQPALTHFRIKDGTVVGFNGIIALSSPIDLDLTAYPQAFKFVQAIERCNATTTSIHLTPGGRLSIKSGSFKALIECNDQTEILDRILPEGVGAEVPGEIISAFKVLEPFMGTDASRPWSNGILLRGQSAYVTNNIIVAELWIGKELPEMNIPAMAIRELIRIGQEPIALSMAENSVTFHFDNGRWMRTQLLIDQWPDVSRMLDQKGDFKPLPEGFFTSVEMLEPFLDKEGHVYFRGNRVSTIPYPDGDEGGGAVVDTDGVPEYGAYNYEHLVSLKGVVSTIDFSVHPKACPFRGNKMRGIFMGMYDTSTESVTS